MRNAITLTGLALLASVAATTAQAAGNQVITVGPQAGGPTATNNLSANPPAPLGHGEARLTQVGGFVGTVPMKLQGSTLVLASNNMNHAVKYKGEIRCPGSLDAREFGYRTSYASAKPLDEYTGESEWQDTFFAWTFTEETLETQCRAALEANPDKMTVKIDLEASAEDEVAFFAWCHPPAGGDQTAWFYDSEAHGNENVVPRSRVTCKRQGMAAVDRPGQRLRTRAAATQEAPVQMQLATPKSQRLVARTVQLKKLKARARRGN